MQKISQVGSQLREKRRQTEEQLQMEFQESLRRLEANLIELSNSKLTQIERDITEIARQSLNEPSERSRWRKLIAVLSLSALICGLMLGIFATLYLLPVKQSDSVEISRANIITGTDGVKWVRLKDIPQIKIREK